MKLYLNECKLICRNCKTYSELVTGIFNREKITRSTSAQGINMIFNIVENLLCGECLSKEDWLFLDREGEEKLVRSQFKICIFKENKNFSYKASSGSLSAIEIYLAYDTIKKEIKKEKIKKQDLESDGNAFIMVDFLTEMPGSRIANFNYNGITIEEIENIINEASHSQPNEDLPESLIKNLENGLKDLLANRENPIILAHLQSRDKKMNVYLIAKKPNEESYYGIIEHPLVKERRISAFTQSTIENLQLIVENFAPFRAKKFIELGKIEKL